jgi:hypothetical protein
MLAWAQPLLHYTASSAAAIRQMKSHGDKRVHVIFKVFHDLHRQLEHLPHDGNIAVRPTPRFAQEMEGWLIKAATGEQLPDRQAIRRRIAAPLMKQVEVDLSEEVQQLCAGRLGLHGASRRATNLAQSFGFTRVRVYQLLDTCAKAFAVRWPEGRYHLAALAARYHLADPEPHEARQLLDRTRELFYPPKFAAKPKADDA